MTQSLRERLLSYMQKHHSEWIASGDLQRMVMEYTQYTPSNASRRLRELCEEGKIIRELRNGHAWYKAAPHPHI